MNENAYQETLFAEPLGLQLKHAREKRGMKASDASARLKFPLDVIDALEREDWKKLGAPIYARSYLTSYLKLLDLPVSLAGDVSFEMASTSSMKLLSEKPIRRNIDKTLSTLGYFAITGVIVTSIIMLAMHFQAPASRSESLPLDIQSQTQAPVALPEQQSSATVDQNITEATVQAPVMASMAPITANAVAGQWEIRVNADTWLEIIDSKGLRIQNGIVTAGTITQYNREQIASITIGNADQVQILRNGQAIDFSAFKQDNVARFKIANDGNLVAKNSVQ